MLNSHYLSMIHESARKPKIQIKRRCGAITESQIIAFEKELNKTLPEDYRTFLRMYNGGDGYVGEFCEVEFLSLDQNERQCIHNYRDLIGVDNMLPIAIAENKLIGMSMNNVTFGKIYIIEGKERFYEAASSFKKYLDELTTENVIEETTVDMDEGSKKNSKVPISGDRLAKNPPKDIIDEFLQDEKVQDFIGLSKKYVDGGLSPREAAKFSSLFEDPKVKAYIDAAAYTGIRDGWIKGGITGSITGALAGAAGAAALGAPAIILAALAVLGGAALGVSTGYLTSRALMILRKWKAQDDVVSGKTMGHLAIYHR